VWPQGKPVKGIVMGDHVLISPGVRLTASNHIHISDSCMLASNVYISDSDWHDIYNRAISVPSKTSVVLEENVWVGDSAIVGKGVRIGKNSIIGAGSVVTSDIPPNVIAAGNPARVVKTFDPEKTITSRKDWFEEYDKSNKMYYFFEKEQLKSNTLFGWLRSIFLPKRESQYDK
jgi:acetyltransferase-like isoleucine patch superfamily enzyme